MFAHIKEPLLIYDIYLVSTPKDKDLLDMLKLRLHQEKKNIKLQCLDDVQANESSWKHDVCMAMRTCARYAYIMLIYLLLMDIVHNSESDHARMLIVFRGYYAHTEVDGT